MGFPGNGTHFVFKSGDSHAFKEAQVRLRMGLRQTSVGTYSIV